MFRNGLLLFLVLCLFQVARGADENCSSDGSANIDDGNESEVHPVVHSVPGIRPGSHRYHVDDGFFYHRQRCSNGRVFLRCVLYRSNPSCSVRCVMNEDMSGFVITSGQHNHGPDYLHQQVHDLRNNLLTACRARPNARVDIIYHDVCRNVPREVSSRISLLSIRPSMVRTQSEHRPNIPYSFEELDEVMRNHRDLGRSVDGESDIYQGITGMFGHRSLLFMSRRVFVGEIRYLFGDGTFYSRPNHPESIQLFTLVTIRDNHILPLAYALMESRSQVAYHDLLTFIRRVIPELDPDFFMSDFETALQNAVSEVFPRARLSGCLWHYARAVCRHVRSLGLHALVRDNENARRVVRQCLAIPLAPPNRLLEALNAVVIESRRLNLLDQLSDLLNYVRTTWILGVGDRILSVFGVRHRTNNVAEAHHRNLNARVVRRPNLWRFIDMVREMEDIAWRDLGRLEIGMAPSRARRVSSLVNDARIRSCSRQVFHQEMDMLHFLSTVSWHLDTTLQDSLTERMNEDEGRPPSPVRGPPRTAQDDIRFGQENLRDSLIIEDVQSHDANNHESQIDGADLFEDLMEQNNNENGIPSRRGRGGRSRTRGGGRQRRSTTSSRARTTRSLPAASSQTACHQPPTGGTSGRTGRSLPAGSEQGLSSTCPRSDDSHSRVRPPPLNLRPEEFSDGEELDDNDELRRWRECIICNARVGRYTTLGCGAFPVCGHCINQWFINLRNAHCPHCRGRNFGWVRLDL